MVVRNEATRLPHVFAHHRGLGIDRFFVVDNGSTDGSRDWLLAQPDCHVFATEDSFREAGCGMAWINALLAFLTVGSWCLFIDADELLVYPFCETLRLSRFCAFLDATGSEGVETLMLDMYSRGPVHRAHYAADCPSSASARISTAATPEAGASARAPRRSSMSAARACACSIPSSQASAGPGCLRAARGGWRAFIRWASGSACRACPGAAPCRPNCARWRC